MFQFPQPIDKKRRDDLLEAMAKRIEQFGMVVPAIFFLEMNKPLSYLGGQAMHFFAPIVGVLFPTFEDYAYFFDDRQNVELLIQRLEAIAQSEDEERKRAKMEKKKSRGAKKSNAMLDEAMSMEKPKDESGPKNLGTQ